MIQHLAEICLEAEQLRRFFQHQLSDTIVAAMYTQAEAIAQKAVIHPEEKAPAWDNQLDDLLTSRLWGYPIMLALLSGVFWLTIQGANLPSQLLTKALFTFQDQLTDWFVTLQAPAWLHGVLVLGLYRTTAWVVAVMLPPMAIFFPLFTLLEDAGYLPRVAFNLDNMFKKCKACGKQVLTMCMGFGCNAAGVVACRIIDSPRERIIALLTNNFVPCNGRFPTLIAISTIFMGGALGTEYSTLIVSLIITAVVLLGIGFTFAISWGLSHTFLKGEPSSLVLELPPYRMPQIAATLYTSMISRTLFVLRRALFMAAPAGALTWTLGNLYLGDSNILSYLAALLQPLAHSIGLDGFILLAFLLGLPANEIVIPILLMSYLSSGYLVEYESLENLGAILLLQGWSWLTALNMLLFCLLHWPCTTTLLSIYKESGSRKWTLIAFLLPTTIAFTVCFIVTQTARGLGLA